MLNIIGGIAGSGKSKRISELIRESTSERILVINDYGGLELFNSFLGPHTTSLEVAQVTYWEHLLNLVYNFPGAEIYIDLSHLVRGADRERVLFLISKLNNVDIYLVKQTPRGAGNSANRTVSVMKYIFQEELK